MNKLAAVMLGLNDDPITYLEKVAIEVPSRPSLLDRLFGGETYDNKNRLREEALAAQEKIRKAKLNMQTASEIRGAARDLNPLAAADRFVASPTGRALGKGALATGGAITLLSLASILSKQRQQGGAQ